MKTIKELEIDRQHYVIVRMSDGEVSFHREKTVIDDYQFEPVTVYDAELTGDTANPVKVIRTVARAITEWMKATRPYYFYFEANDPRKKRIYEKLFAKQIKPLAGFHYVYEEGKYHIYKKEEL